MTGKILDFRLRKVEQALKVGSPYERMTEPQLLAIITENLNAVCGPYGSVTAAADAMRHSADPDESACARALDYLTANWNDLYPQPMAG